MPLINDQCVYVQCMYVCLTEAIFYRLHADLILYAFKKPWLFRFRSATREGVNRRRNNAKRTREVSVDAITIFDLRMYYSCQISVSHPTKNHEKCQALRSFKCEAVFFL